MAQISLESPSAQTYLPQDVEAREGLKSVFHSVILWSSQSQKELPRWIGSED